MLSLPVPKLVVRNKAILEACKPLGEYSWLVEEVRKNNKSQDEEGMSSAVDKAISAMPDDYVIKSFLVAHRADTYFTWRGIFEPSEIAYRVGERDAINRIQ